MGELIKGVLVDEGHETDHQRHTAVPAGDIGIAALL